MQLHFWFLLLILFNSCSMGQRQALLYEVGGQSHQGYLAQAKVKEGEKKPAILIVHEWWGHNDYVRSRADQLAKLGYTAFAVDMYGDGKIAEHPQDANEFSSQSNKNFAEQKKKFLRGLEILKQQPGVDPERIVAIGYCFGGGVVLNMARSGVDLYAVASFHGSLKPHSEVKKLKPLNVDKILVFNGEADPMVSLADKTAFRKEMKSRNAELMMVDYPGVKHAFTNPQANEYAQKFNLPLAYDRQADLDSWERFLEVLAE